MAAILLVMGHANAARAQTSDDSESVKQQATTDDLEGREIVVEVDGVPVVETPTEIVSAGGNRIKNGIKLDKAQIFVRCLHDIDPAALRAILDGPPRKASTFQAQGLLVSTHIACHLGHTPSWSGDVKSLGTSIYDRGALLEYALDTYAPGLSLTPRETNDPVVQQRFNAREVPRNQWRLANDYFYFTVAVCMVREAPEYSMRLIRSPINSKLQRQLQNAIIGTARHCVGDARKVVVDSTQFRMYIGDAVWRWAEAARNVDSLIPLPD